MEQNNYTLKINAFYEAINKQDLKIKDIATDMCIPIGKLKKKLQRKEPFAKEHIRYLTYLFGAETMFNVIYFPNKKFREQVYKKVFLRGGGKRVCHKI